MRRIAYLLVAAFVLSGCGVLTKEDLKPQAKTLTHGRLVYLADRACRHEKRHIPVFKPGTSPAEAERKLHKVLLPTYDHLLFNLHGLAPPPADAVAYRRMLATLNDSDLIIHHAVDAVDALQRQRVRSLVRRLDFLGRRLNNRAAKLGLHTCAGT